MSNRTFLHKRLEEAGRPFVVSHIDDTIYDADQSKESSDFIELEGGLRVPLVPFSEITKKENDEVEYENVNQRKSEIQQQFQELEKKKMDREAGDDNILLFNFIRYAFLNYVNITDREILPDDSASLVSTVDASKFKLNAGESASVLKRTLAKQSSFLFMRGKCFLLSEKPGPSPQGERVFLKNKNYWPEFTCAAEEFDKRYADCIQTAFEAKIQEFYQAELAQLSTQQQKVTEMEKMLLAQRKEDKHGLIGFAKINSLYYLYTYHRGPADSRYYYKIPVPDAKAEFGWFPPLALGLNITANKGKLRFHIKVDDRDNIRILHPAPYEHPAVIDFRKPDLCLRIGSYGYPKDGVGFDWSKRAGFLDAIRNVFEQATAAIQTGWATDEGKSIVYHGGIDGPAFKEYKDLKKPIGWADDLLKWEGLKCNSRT